jgi:P-type E1-E2 ATPase
MLLTTHYCCITGLEVSVEKVQVGTIIQVKPGEKVPIDGVIVSGTSRIDQSMLTGEPVPVKKVQGDEVRRC